MCVCLYVLCGHLLGKGWPLGSRLWCLLWVCHFPIGILGQVWYLIVSIPDLCSLTYFVLAPADKAANNVVVVWKRYYINTLKQELSTAEIYEHNRLDETTIVDRQRCNMAAKCGLAVDEDHSKLPTLYWLPKLHERPYKSRLLTILVHAQLLSCQFFWLLASLQFKTMSLNIAKQFMKKW